MALTETSQYKNRKVSGYMLNAGLNSENQQIIANINAEIKNKFGHIILEQPGSALHITLMDWVAPLVQYEETWDALFERMFPVYDENLSELTSKIGAFTVVFDTIEVSPAAIFIQGHDNGEFDSIRNGFTDKIALLPGTKQPPKIIHCTIARFDAKVDIAPIEEFVNTLSLNFMQPIESFRLVHETEMPMLSYEVLKSYPLDVF